MGQPRVDRQRPLRGLCHLERYPNGLYEYIFDINIVDTYIFEIKKYKIYSIKILRIMYQYQKALSIEKKTIYYIEMISISTMIL